MNPSFKAAVVGPSRVGKTTLLTAILTETEDLLAGSPVRVTFDEKTAGRVRRQRISLHKAIEKGEFDAASLGGTQDDSRYQVTLQSVGDESVEIPFSILDYPGRWLDPEYRGEHPEAAAKWPECDRHMKESVMLLVPIDSAVLMEAVTPTQRGAVFDLLATEDVQTVARRWAQTRNLEEHRDEPAVIVLAPLKCEKYFDDNVDAVRDGGRGAARLRARVLDVYGPMIDVVRREARNRDVRIVYAPIDTYGCVELMEANWREIDGQTDFEAHYRFRGRPPVISVKAAGAIMQELCRCIVDGWDSLQKQEIARHQLSRSRLNDRIGERKGFWGTFRYYWGGEAEKNLNQVTWLSSAVDAAERRRLQLEEGVKKLAAAADDPRVERW